MFCDGLRGNEMKPELDKRAIVPDDWMLVNPFSSVVINDCFIEVLKT